MADLTAQEAAQVAQQAAQSAAQAAQEIKQVAQQVSEQLSQGVRQMQNATMTAAPQEVGAEREFETGKDEAWFANVKRSYDEYQDVSLTHARNLNTVALQAIQNAVESQNMLSKRTISGFEVAQDRTWNVDEVSTLTAKSGVQADAFVDLLAAVLAEKIAKN